MNLSSLAETLADRNLDFLAGAPVVYHCHHYNLFLDQSIDDALGPAAGAQTRTAAAQDAGRQLLKNLCAASGARTPAERLELAQEAFRALGHGRLRIDADASGGRAEGEYLHYGFAWREKYGSVVRRSRPLDAVGAGFAAAAVEVAFDAEPLAASEHHCIATEHERCTFELVPGPRTAPSALVDRDNTASNPPTGGIEEDRILAISAGLRDFLGGVAGDERGMIDAFGVYVTRHLTNYYNAISYSALDQITAKRPSFAPMVEGLLREAGHVCVFNTIGGIMYSPEWDALVGRVQGDLEEVVSSGCAIARALGMGSWAIKEISPDHLILQTGSDYESPYCSAVLGRDEADCNHFIQGAALAFMRLWEALDWQERPPLDQTLYNALFRSGKQWQVQQTRSLSAGHSAAEFVVTRA